MECPVCLEPYDLQRHRPKVLVPCGHSVCLQCLRDPGFGGQCPQDRQPIEEDLEQLPDCMTAISLIAQGGATPRSVFWCRDCGRDLTEECVEAGHASCTRRQLRSERASAHTETLERTAAACTALEQHFAAVHQDAQRHMQGCQSQQRQLQRALARLRKAASLPDDGGAALEEAVRSAEQLAARLERLEEAAALAGLRGRCSVVVQAEDGAEWRASVALDEAWRRALRHALLELRADGDLTKVETNAVGAVDLDAELQALDLSGRSPIEMTPQQQAELLQDSGLKKVRSLSGVDCSQAPKFCELLLQAVAPHLESLQMVDPAREHMRTLKAMPFLRKLSVASADGGAVAEASELPASLVELTIRKASLQHMRLVQDLPLLRKLEVVCDKYGDSCPDLPSQLEELTLEICSKQQLLSIQRMPRLRRLALYGLLSVRDAVVPRPPSQHCGLSWLRLASSHELPQMSLIHAHAATLVEIQLFAGSDEDDGIYHFAGLADCLRRADLRVLRRFVLLRRPGDDGWCAWCTPQHSAEACRRQVRELQDALLRRDAAGRVEVVPVVCQLCDGGVEL